MASKTALFLHGWPQYNIDNHFLVKHLKNNGYKVFTPNLFLSESVFNIENLKNIVLEETKGSKLNLIIGISFGGIILPHIAADFPEAKLIFISTGASFNPKPKMFNFFLKMAKHKSFVKVSEYLLKLPAPAIEAIYKNADPFDGKPDQKGKYINDMQDNIRFIKTIPVYKEVELVNFARITDNSEILKKLNNSSLIFAGRQDLLMPEKGGEKLAGLLSKSKLIVNDGEHFNVLTEKDLKIIDNFLGY